MPTATMTSRQRVNAALERKDHDRIPRHDTFWDQTIQRWQSEGLDGNARAVLDLLGSDLWGTCFLWPHVYPDSEVLAEDHETVTRRDQFGRTARWWKQQAGTPEHLGFECNSRAAWEEKFKPLMIEREYQLNLDYIRDQHAKGRSKDQWVYLAGVEVFETTRAMIGDEDTAIGMALDPEWIEDVARTVTDRVLAEYQRVLDAGLEFDGLWTFGDMAYNHATFCSPAMYKELVWPQHKRLVDFAHANGMKFIYHTDGHVHGVMDLWVDAGFDGFHPIEAKADMDVRQLAPQYGDQLSFFGNIDVMVMSTNDQEKIEHEMRTKFEAGMAHKGYLYHSDHSVPPAVSWETYQFIMKKVEELGGYS